MKVVINKCYGGFGLSYKAHMRYAELSGFELYAYKEVYTGKGKPQYIPVENLEEKDSIFLNYYYSPLVEGEKEKEKDFFYYGDLERTDPILVQVVEELGEEASGRCSALKVVEIPDGIEWEIDEYDGLESIEEKHRSWD